MCSLLRSIGRRTLAKADVVEFLEETAPTEPVLPAPSFWFSLLGASSPFPRSLLEPLLFEEHATAELNEPAITAVHTTTWVIPASSLVYQTKSASLGVPW
jgi:hypothetical protein